MTALFSNKGRIGTSTRMPLDNLVDSLRDQLHNHGTAFATKQLSQAAISMEGIDVSIARELDSSLDQLNVTLEAIASEHSRKLSVTRASPRWRSPATCRASCTPR
jgi:hypothetical protein